MYVLSWFVKESNRTSFIGSVPFIHSIIPTLQNAWRERNHSAASLKWIFFQDTVNVQTSLISYIKQYFMQICIPVGCVPSTSVAVSGGGVPGCVSPQPLCTHTPMHTYPLCLGARWDTHSPTHAHAGIHTPLVNRITDTCKTLHCPKLRLQVVKICDAIWYQRFAVNTFEISSGWFTSESSEQLDRSWG